MIWQYCLLSLLKIQYKFNKNVTQFFNFILNLNINKNRRDNHIYSQFIESLATKYHKLIVDNSKEKINELKYDIIQFMKSQYIMFTSFENLQEWLYELLCNDDNNKSLVEYLFNLMVLGMLYNDNFNIRPQLRGLLRFGSYYQLQFIPNILFKDEQIMYYFNDSIFNLHHPLHPFKFYIQQIIEYNQNKQIEAHHHDDHRANDYRANDDHHDHNRDKQQYKLIEKSQKTSKSKSKSSEATTHSVQVCDKILDFNITPLSNAQLRNYFGS